ncbi:MAG: ABC transporter ATP-binding protein [Coprobacillaceae bacterium]
MKIIDITSITKDYGNQKGVFDVTFQVDKGEVLGFLGPNGAGKTTTIRQLMGFIKPDKGTVRILNMDCFKEVEKIQKEVGYLPGEIAFIDDMTGQQFIQFIADMKNIRENSKAKELIAYFEIDTHMKIHKMSKGMKQKIAIICAFMQDPDILILDEPTSGLDPLMQNKFVDLIKEEKSKGKTILMSSHIFEEVEKTCDRVAIIKEGKIVAIENMLDLTKKRVKQFEITFSSPQEVESFITKYPEAIINELMVTIKIKDISSFIKQLSKYTVTNINIKEQTIEELFLHYYGGDQHA